MKKVVPLLLSFPVWMLEGVPLLRPNQAHEYMLWGGIYCGIFPMVCKLMFGSMSFYLEQDELPELRPGAATTFKVFCLLHLAAGLASCWMFWRQGQYWGSVFPIIQGVLLLKLYKGLF